MVAHSGTWGNVVAFRKAIQRRRHLRCDLDSPGVETQSQEKTPVVFRNVELFSVFSP